MDYFATFSSQSVIFPNYTFCTRFLTNVWTGHCFHQKQIMGLIQTASARRFAESCNSQNSKKLLKCTNVIYEFKLMLQRVVKFSSLFGHLHWDISPIISCTILYTLQYFHEFYENWIIHQTWYFYWNVLAAIGLKKDVCECVIYHVL